MNAKLTTSLMLGLALMAITPGAATAGGDYYAGGGSVKDYGGTPVPAPIPVPTYDPVWYFRGDVGLQFGDAPGMSETGMVFGEKQNGGYEGTHTFGPAADDLRSQYDSSVNFSVGVGYRWSDRFRTDLTAETVRDQSFQINDRRRVALLLHNVRTLGFIQTSYDDQMDSRGGAILLNGYYDLPVSWGGFTPYVGGGLGFALLSVDRTNTTIETAFDRTGSPAAQHRQFSSSSSSSENQTQLAAMATVGTTYRLSDITELDFNYRYFYVNGVDASLMVNGHPSTIETGSTNDHQLRAGVRFNID